MVKLGFIGSGAMASAVACGLSKSPESYSFMFSDPSPAALANVKKICPQAKTTSDNATLVSSNEVIVFAVKPQFFSSAAETAKSSFQPTQLVVSIMAGVNLKQLEAAVGVEGMPIIRVMPNTPLQVGKGATAYCGNRHVKDEHFKLVDKMFSELGFSDKVEERLMDAVTGLSGSGPAFVLMFIEALADGGVLAGLPRPLALKLAAQTVMGSASMILQQGAHPAQLKDMVTSPAGTTIQGVFALEQQRFRGTVMSAVNAAAKRSAQLSAKL